MLTQAEKEIMDNAVMSATCWGLSIMKTCKEDIQDYEYTWTDAHEKYVFDKYVEGPYKKR